MSEPVLTNDWDWNLIGYNVRQGRIMRGYSQEEFATNAGVALSTVYHAEKGMPISRRSLSKICAALDESFDSIRTRKRRLLTNDIDYLLYQGGSSPWTGDLDSRKNVPDDNFQRVQDPQERMRLGRLGLVKVFLSTTNFVMPQGPGLTFIELFDRIDEPINSVIYRDCLITCTAGAARLSINGKVVELGVGDYIGYRSKELDWIEPITPNGSEDLPACLTWIGAVRVGRLPEDISASDRVRRKGRGERQPE